MKKRRRIVGQWEYDEGTNGYPRFRRLYRGVWLCVTHCPYGHYHWYAISQETAEALPEGTSELTRAQMLAKSYFLASDANEAKAIALSGLDAYFSDPDSWVDRVHGPNGEALSGLVLDAPEEL